ncbi:MAG: hypothetical protein ACYC5H_16240 [Methylovirgula sp.]
MDLFAFLAKTLGATARMGFAIALAALILWLGRRAKIDFFVTLDPVIFSAMIVAGIVGGCIVVAELTFSLIAFGKNCLVILLPILMEKHNEKGIALKNLKCLTDTQAATLLYLKANNLRRFRASATNELLHIMTKDALLSSASHTYSASQTYYVVPNYVWNKVEKHLRNRKVPEHPPWENFERRC